MESHKRILGILFIVSGTLTIFGMVFVTAFFSLLFPVVLQDVPADDQWVVSWLVPMLQTIGWGVIILFAIPKIIAGIGLLNHKPWAMTVALVFGCLSVFSFPVGTALCVYTIWVYIEDNKAKRANA